MIAVAATLGWLTLRAEAVSVRSADSQGETQQLQRVL
jgi:hypothetical protein